MHPNQILLDLMEERDLSQTKVAEICRCSRSTVIYWTRPVDHRNYQLMKPRHLRLLLLELGEAAPDYTK